MSLTIKQAAKAPAKYDIHVHRNDSRQVVIRLLRFLSAFTVLTRPELSRYCTRASDHAARIRRLESATICCGLPNTRVTSELAAKTDRLIAPALNGATFLRLGNRSEHNSAFTPASTTEGHTP